MILDGEGQPTGALNPGRRPSQQIIPVPSARRGARQGQLDLGEAPQETRQNQLINDIRERVELWRRGLVPGRCSAETERLLRHWSSEDRERKLFFCQREALETLIYLTEVEPDRFAARLKEASDQGHSSLFRLASKMATGSGKTTVMAMIIAWHAVNKARRPRGGRFTNRFLVVCPGVTIRDRLRVLQPDHPENIYDALDLVPPDLLDAVRQARIVITNFHAFQKRDTVSLTGEARRQLGGRAGPKRFIESDGVMVARVAREFAGGPKILVLNDEAHHCYRAKPKGGDGEAKAEKLSVEEREEAKKAAEEGRVWINGLEAFDREVGVLAVHDVSATPFFLRGSGEPEGTLFNWVVSDFGLIEAIECGIVKVPRLPTMDDRVQGDLPLFRDLYNSVRAKGQSLPRQGRAKQTAGRPEDLPPLLLSALEALYGDYEKQFAAWAADPAIGRPPVFIVVCANTSISKQVHDWIAGYTRTDGEASRPIPGKLALFRNIEADGRAAPTLRTLLIDSEQLDSGEALSPEFLAASAEPIEQFRAQLRKRPQAGLNPDKLAVADLLREAMNTIGRPGRLGGDIRCVVSVSMLTEGWDANTVTHILGFRAFGTQLLCEQVVGRGLRRVSYEPDPVTGLLPTEYAEVLGVPFTFSANAAAGPPSAPAPITHVTARRDRPDLTIRFPRVEGYRLAFPPRQPLRALFTEDSEYHRSTDDIPTRTEVEPIIGEAITLDLRKDAEALRLKSVIFDVAGLTLNTYFRDPAGAVEVWRYPELARITEAWFARCLKCHGAFKPQFLKWRLFAKDAAERIHNAIARSLDSQPDQANRRLPILDPFNPEGSTAYVDFTTCKTRVMRTERSALTHVVADSDWELAFAEMLEQTPAPILSYVKNHAVHFEIPYVIGGAEHRYRPDYVVRLEDGGGSGGMGPLNLVVEIKGRKDEAARAKGDTVSALWIPAVNNAGRFGRWAFVEIGEAIHDAEATIAAFARRRAA